MKKSFVCLFIIFLSTFAFSKELKIQRIRFNETMTYDKNDKFRYSPLKIFDKKIDTAFAVPQNKTYDNLLLILHFDKEYDLDEIDICAGYFDTKWYSSNYRIKEIEFVLNYNEQVSVSKEKFILNDEMKSQKLYFSETKKVKDIWIKARNLYPSKAYNDICISEMTFKNNGEEYNVVFRPAYYFFGSEYEYDTKGNLIKEKIRADHDYTELNYRMIDNKLIGNWEYIDDDGVQKKHDYKTITYSDNLIEINFGQTHIKHYYDNNKIKRSEMKNYLGEIYNINYYYKNDILDHTDYGEFFYENGLLKGYIAYDYCHMDKEKYQIEKINDVFCSYYLEYNDNNQIIKRAVDSWNGYSGIK